MTGKQQKWEKIIFGDAIKFSNYIMKDSNKSVALGGKKPRGGDQLVTKAGGPMSRTHSVKTVRSDNIFNFTVQNIAFTITTLSISSSLCSICA